MSSFIDSFNELEATFAVVTETWLSSNDRTKEKFTEDLLLGSGISCWMKSRQPNAAGVCHGGVAIMARASTTSMKKFDINNPEDFEILAVQGSIKRVERKCFVIAAYIPPNYSVPQAKKCMKVIYNTVMDIKNRFTDPYIILAGDFNQFAIDTALEDYVDIWEAFGGPTRADRTIDRFLTNFPPVSTSCCVLPPLQSENNTLSDHNIVCLSTEIAAKERNEWKVHIYRKTSPEQEQCFIAEMNATNWENVISEVGVEAKHALFQDTIDKLMDKHFPWKKSRRREGDLPWLDDLGRKKIRRKKAIYRDEGKSERWKKAQANLEKYMGKRQETFLEKQRNNLLSDDASKNFFKNIKNFSTVEKPKSFSITELRPGKSDKEVADEAATFFNSISQEFSPLQQVDIPTSFERVLPKITVPQVKAMLQKQKKPNSMVKGDIFPKLIGSCIDSLALPLSSIYNEIVREGMWPKKWQVEYVTLIPKKTMPSEFADMRNISCTAFFSKVMESFLLLWAMDEISLKNNQYGGVKGCSTTHMLLDIWQDICSDLEDHRSATVLTSIDYAKAFNRLSYQECLQSFHKKGASSTVIRLIAAFLTGRVMKVRAGNEWSNARNVDGGCPQGSILGVFLFNTTTDDLEDDFVDFDEQQQQLHQRERQPRLQQQQQLQPGEEIEMLPMARNIPSFLVVPHAEAPVGTQVLVRKLTNVYKYIDDNVVSEKLNFGNIQSNMIYGVWVREKQAFSSQNAFRTIVRNATAKGMKVNNSKTNIICITDSLSHERKTFIVDESGERIESCDEMKILGFNFSKKPTVHAQVKSIIKKFRQRYWSLRHLKKIGFNQEELVKMYTTVIRPIADYTDVIYHSMLTDEQDELLENAQNAALRCIFDPRLSGRKLRKLANLKTLRQRRVQHVDKFASRCVANPRFSHLFPVKTTRQSARNPEKFIENFARCDRLKNSPLYFMRRRLNGKEGKSYGERYRIYRGT